MDLLVEEVSKMREVLGGVAVMVVLPIVVFRCLLCSFGTRGRGGGGGYCVELGWERFERNIEVG